MLGYTHVYMVTLAPSNIYHVIPYQLYYSHTKFVYVVLE